MYNEKANNTHNSKRPKTKVKLFHINHKLFESGRPSSLT